MPNAPVAIESSDTKQRPAYNTTGIKSGATEPNQPETNEPENKSERTLCNFLTAVRTQDIYINEPCGAVSDDACKKILGGQGEMWGETVDGSNLQVTVCQDNPVR